MQRLVADSLQSGWPEETSIRGVSDVEYVRDWWTVQTLKVSGSALTVQDRHYRLEHNVHVVAFGKAAFGMVQGAEAALGHHIVRGVASVPFGSLEILDSKYSC